MIASLERATRTLALTKEDQEYLRQFEHLMDRLRDRTVSVAEKFQSGAYLVGRAGSSKTFTVLETLKKRKAPYAYRNARMIAPGLFAFLEEHPEHCCVLDDIPALFDQRQALQTLMAAMGGEPGKPRPMTYTIKSKHERKSFEFGGGIIAISNLPLRRGPLAEAVASRVVILEHEPTDEMLAAFMRSQALTGYEDMTAGECLEVVEFVIAEAIGSDYRLDLRHMKKAWQDFRQDKQGKALRPWQKLVRTSMKRVIKDEIRPVCRADEQARFRDIALELFKRFPKDRGHREEQWWTLTGKSSDMLYRRGRRLKAEGLV